MIRLHPLACGPMNTDFDGDQLTVSLPLTRAAQQEAGERLSFAAHLTRSAVVSKTGCEAQRFLRRRVASAT